jgi:Na+/H+-dicarboxylate symporter
MKVWLKLLLGSALGIGLSFLIPEGEAVLKGLAWLEGLAIRIGRYATVPILVFSLVIAVYELRQDGKFWRLVFGTLLVLAGCGIFVIAGGILVTLFFPPARIPILIEEQVEQVSLGTAENILDLFPSNMFSVLAGDGIYLLPAAVFAFFLGLGLSYDKNWTKPVIALVDSLSRIFFHIVSFFSEILALVLIILSVNWAVRFNGVIKTDALRELAVLLGVMSGILGCVILPLFLYVIRPRANPWAALYGSLGQGIAAFFSGDINFSFPMLVRHVKENLGVRRRCSAVTLSLFTIFGRAGSAMVAASAFIVIIKSYSSLGLSSADLCSIGGRAFLISLLLARHPGNGAWTALAVLCLGYGKGFEAGYLILKPLAFYLIAVGTFLDVMIASFASYGIAKVWGLQEDPGVRHFV